MRDLREFDTLPRDWPELLKFWSGAVFVWKKWEGYNENSTHDHCWPCFACICDHRERFPEWKQAHDERGCYRHAYFSEREPGIYLWVCRNCFKRLKSGLNWTVESPK
jgi:hypothetical protein